MSSTTAASSLNGGSGTDADYQQCVFTQVGHFIQTINIQLPFFGILSLSVFFLLAVCLFSPFLSSLSFFRHNYLLRQYGLCFGFCHLPLCFAMSPQQSLPRPQGSTPPSLFLFFLSFLTFSSVLFSESRTRKTISSTPTHKPTSSIFLYAK
jgi:hypothetical protein